MKTMTPANTTSAVRITTIGFERATMIFSFGAPGRIRTDSLLLTRQGSADMSYWGEAEP